jgi:hypothetical protein
MIKRVNLRGVLITLFIVLIFIIPLISAGVIGETWDKITGKATSQNMVLNISISNY